MAPIPPAKPVSPELLDSVLEDRNILREVLLDVESPATLARAAAVSKLWLETAAEPAFLRRFGDLHPPALLGFYVTTVDYPATCFVPMPQLPEELAAVVRRGSFDMGHDVDNIFCCRDGRVVTGAADDDYAVRRMLCSNGGPPTALPRPPMLPERDYQVEDGDAIVTLGQAILLPDVGSGDATSCIALTLLRAEQQRMVWAYVRDFQAGGAWGEEGRSSNKIQLPERFDGRVNNFCVLAQGMAYMIGMRRHVLALDFASMHLFPISLPEGVQYDVRETNLGLARAEGRSAGVYLVHVEGFELSVWLYSVDTGGPFGWKLVDTVDLPQAFGHLADSSGLSAGAICNVSAVGDNASFVFLQIMHEVFHLHVSSREVKQVYELPLSVRDLYLSHRLMVKVDPVMMVSAPSFRVPNRGLDQVQ